MFTCVRRSTAEAFGPCELTDRQDSQYARWRVTWPMFQRPAKRYGSMRAT